MIKGARYAGLWERFFALVIDGVLFCVFFFPITRMVKGVWLMGATDHRWAYGLFITDPLCLEFLAVIFLYFVLLEGLAGATLGKAVLGLRVVQVDGSKPGLLKSLIRNILRVIDGLPAFNIVGVIFILRSKEKARFGDRRAGTRVVKLCTSVFGFDPTYVLHKLSLQILAKLRSISKRFAR